MRIFLITLILVINFQSWIKADDIRDFQIEGISVGDSLLDHFTISEIKNAYKNTYPNSKKFYGLQFLLINYEVYEVIQVHLKADSNYIISSLSGGEFFDNINKCYSKKKVIVKDLKNMFPNAELNEGKRNFRNDTMSTFSASEFYLSNFEVVISCTDWSKKKESAGSKDNLRVEISTIEFSDFIRYEAY